MSDDCAYYPVHTCYRWRGPATALLDADARRDYSTALPPPKDACESWWKKPESLRVGAMSPFHAAQWIALQMSLCGLTGDVLHREHKACMVRLSNTLACGWEGDTRFGEHMALGVVATTVYVTEAEYVDLVDQMPLRE